MKEIDRRLRVLDLVIRHLVVRVDEELRVAQRTPTRGRQFMAAPARRARPAAGAAAGRRTRR